MCACIEVVGAWVGCCCPLTCHTHKPHVGEGVAALHGCPPPLTQPSPLPRLRPIPSFCTLIHLPTPAALSLLPPLLPAADVQVIQLTSGSPEEAVARHFGIQLGKGLGQGSFGKVFMGESGSVLAYHYCSGVLHLWGVCTEPAFTGPQPAGWQTVAPGDEQVPVAGVGSAHYALWRPGVAAAGSLDGLTVAVKMVSFPYGDQSTLRAVWREVNYSTHRSHPRLVHNMLSRLVTLRRERR